jgi:hypothetical protein
MISQAGVCLSVSQHAPAATYPQPDKRDKDDKVKAPAKMRKISTGGAGAQNLNFCTFAPLHQK